MMTADTFIDNFDLLAEAPGGAPKLRELILQLAVRGKLMPQDPTDEPASSLLGRISTKRERWFAEAKAKKPPVVPPVDTRRTPFPLPPGWVWTRLGDLAYPQAGFSFKSNQFNRSGSGLPLIRIRDVGQPFSETYYEGDYRNEFIVENGEYVISMDGEFRVAAWDGPQALLNQRVSRLCFFDSAIENTFIINAIQFELRKLQGRKAYTTVDHLSGKQIAHAPIPLPPLAEQKRIVTKVDELMKRCDELEARQSERNESRTALTASCLHAVTSTPRKTAAPAIERALQNFPLLIDTPESVAELRKTILQLAVQGRLVQQDPEDEPAEKLLEMIAKEKHEITGGKRNPPATVKCSEVPYQLPETWSWARLGHLGICATGKTPPTKDTANYGGALPFIGPGQIMPNGDIRDAEKRLTETGALLSEVAMPGDILMVCIGGSIGKCAIVRTRIAFNQQINRLRSVLADGRYACVAMNTEYFQKRVLSSASGSATPIINRSKWEHIPVPVAPLTEQKRIVAKVAELMSLCDTIEAKLTQSREDADTLAAAVVHHLCNGGASRAEGATE